MVFKKLTVLFFLSLNHAFCVAIEVSANSFYVDENKRENILSGDVMIKREKDILKSSRLVVLTDEKHKPVKYTASGKVQFEIMLDDKMYVGSSDLLVYDITNDNYEMRGNAYINQKNTNQKLYGDSIIVDKKQGIYKVLSKNNKPARFVFDLDEK